MITIEQLKDILNFEVWQKSYKSIKKDIFEFCPILSENQVEAIIQNNGTFMIDHLSEWNGGWPAIKGDKDQLPIGLTQKPLAGQNSAFPISPVEATQMDLKPIKESNTLHKKPCSCQSRDLLWSGCRCGGS